MLPIQFDDVFWLHRKVGPPALKGELRRQEKLAVSIDGSLGHPDDALEGYGLSLTFVRSPTTTVPTRLPGLGVLTTPSANTLSRQLRISLPRGFHLTM